MWAFKKKTHNSWLFLFVFFSFLSLFFFTTCTFYMHGKIGGKKESSIRHREIPLPRLCTPRLCLAVFYPCFLFFCLFSMSKTSRYFFFFFCEKFFFFFRGHFFSSPFRFLWLYPHSDPCFFFFLRSLLSIEVYFKLTLWSTVVLTFFLPLLRLLVYSYVLMCPLFFASSFFFLLFECSGSKK